jgi:hypothetical protein
LSWHPKDTKVELRERCELLLLTRKEQGESRRKVLVQEAAEHLGEPLPTRIFDAAYKKVFVPQWSYSAIAVRRPSIALELPDEFLQKRDPLIGLVMCAFRRLFSTTHPPRSISREPVLPARCRSDLCSYGFRIVMADVMQIHGLGHPP